MNATPALFCYNSKDKKKQKEKKKENMCYRIQ